MVVFFIGGVVVRNPEPPNYLLDRIVRNFRGTTTGARSSGAPVANVTPPPSPKTAEEYLNLRNYDEKTLPPDEKAVAAVLNKTVAQLYNTGHARWSTRLAQLYNEQIWTPP